MRRLIVCCMLFLLSFIFSLSVPAEETKNVQTPYNVAIVISTNNVGIIVRETNQQYPKPWYKEILDERFSSVLINYHKDKYSLIPTNVTEEALKTLGYDIMALDMPDKNDLIKLTESTKADAVLIFKVNTIGIGFLKDEKDSLGFYIISQYRALNMTNNKYIARNFTVGTGGTTDMKYFMRINKKDLEHYLDKAIREMVNKTISELPY